MALCHQHKTLILSGANASPTAGGSAWGGESKDLRLFFNELYTQSICFFSKQHRKCCICRSDKKAALPQKTTPAEAGVIVRT
jgi:hypothetical protein